MKTSTLVVDSHLAWRRARFDAAREKTHGLRVLTVAHLAARLAGGFREQVTHDALRDAVRQALSEGGFGEIGAIAALPGTVRAAAGTLGAAWNAGLDLQSRAADSPRIADMALIEARVLERLPASMALPLQLASEAAERVHLAPRLLGDVRVRGIEYLAPVWRALFAALGEHVRVAWALPAGARARWMEGTTIEIVEMPAHAPQIECVSCANPRHEALEAVRWARELMASGVAAPHEIAIAASNTGEWNGHMLALTADSNLPLHFAGGLPALSQPQGQRCAALAEVLLHGLSRERVERLFRLCRQHAVALEPLPEDWRRGLPDGALLLSSAQWREAFEKMKLNGDALGRLTAAVELLAQGPDVAEQAGDALLDGQGRALWAQALLDGPARALDVTLANLGVAPDTDPEACVLWAPAHALAGAPRPFVRLLGMTSRQWPRRSQDDALLPHHIVDRRVLSPLSVSERDRMTHASVKAGTRERLVYSRSRRDGEGRVLGKSPLFPQEARETHLRRGRVPAHATSEADRLLARPDEFASTPLSRSGTACWHNWQSREITEHDGRVRARHPAVLSAVARVHSATSLRKLLRDPLGFVWQYALRLQEPDTPEQPLLLDALAMGSLMHEILESAVRTLETGSGFGAASSSEKNAALEEAAGAVADHWVGSYPVPPALVWKHALQQAVELARAALEEDAESLADQRSFVEITFGGFRGESGEVDAPWDVTQPVVIPGTGIAINGAIDRLDLSGDGARARVTDYKSGKPPKSDELQLGGGAELQRCLYAFAVRSLLAGVKDVDARLLYPRDGGKSLSLRDLDGNLSVLTEYLKVARELLEAGVAPPGKDADGRYNDFAFAYPANAGGVYFNRKRDAAQALLGELAPLWEVE